MAVAYVPWALCHFLMVPWVCLWSVIVALPGLTRLLLSIHLSYDFASVRDITPCIKIDKPLVVNRFSGNVLN